VFVAELYMGVYIAPVFDSWILDTCQREQLIEGYNY